MSSTRVFSIEGKGLKLNTAEDVSEFTKQILEAPDLEEVHLSGNTLGIDAARALSDALAKKEKIRIANFSDAFTGRLRSEIPLALKAICDALESKPHLEELNLSDNAFGPAGAEPMISFLTNTSSLRVLRLNNNGLGVAGGTIIAKALLAAQDLHVKNNRKSNLQVFVAGRNRLENGSAPLLAQAFEAHGTLTEIGMPQNGIRPDGILALSRSLAKCVDLQVLDLQDNTFTEQGAHGLAAALPSWSRLRKLNVGDCLLRSRGGIAVANALASRTFEKLETLLVSFNEIDSKAAKAFTLALPMLPNLKSFDVNGNMFDADGEVAEEMKKVLEKLGRLDALADMDEMEEEEEEEEEEEDEEEGDGADDKEDKIEDADDIVDALAEILEKKARVA